MEIKPTKSINDVVSHLLSLSPVIRQEVFHYIDFMRTRHTDNTISTSNPTPATQSTLSQTLDRTRPSGSIKSKSVRSTPTKEPLEDFEDLFSMKD